MSIPDKELQAIRAAAEAVQGRKLTKDIITLLDEVQRLRTQDEGIQIHASALRREWEEAVEARDEAVRQRGLIYEGLNVARQRLGFLGNWLEFTYKAGPDDVRCARGYEDAADEVLKEANKARARDSRFPCGRCGGSKEVWEVPLPLARSKLIPCPECSPVCGDCNGHGWVCSCGDTRHVPCQGNHRCIPCHVCNRAGEKH